jgi:hypothetical protein
MKPEVKKEKEFDTVAFFRSVKEKMAKATEGMSLQEEREYWRLLREGKKIIQLKVEKGLAS